MMRDSHRPRGNPLFDDLDAGSDAGSDAGFDAGPDAASGTSEEWGETSGASQARFSRSRRARRPPPTSGSANPLVDALMEAGPETAEHLLRAMEELLLAARTVVQAAERGVTEQRRDASGASASDDFAPHNSSATSDDVTRGDTPGDASPGGFSSIDLD